MSGRVHRARITDKNEVKVTGCVTSSARCSRDKHWGAPGCGGDARLYHSQTCGVCVWRVGWGRETEIETERGGRQEGCCRAAAWDKRQRERRQLLWPFSG